MDSHVTFVSGFGLGLATMATVTILLTDALIRHYLRKGWLRFPSPESLNYKTLYVPAREDASE